LFVNKAAFFLVTILLQNARYEFSFLKLVLFQPQQTNTN
jgi:hypothetical protein